MTSQLDTIILTLCLIAAILAGGIIWMVLMFEEIRHRQNQMFDRLLNMTSAAEAECKAIEAERNEMAEEIFECENNVYFEGHKHWRMK